MKRYHRYCIDFDSKASWFSGICFGLPIFLLFVYYLFLQGFDRVSVGERILWLWLPVALSLVYLVLQRLVRWNSPGGFAILGAGICLVLMLQLFTSGNVLRILVGIGLYLIGGGLLILCAGGYLPGRMVVSLVFLAVLLLRVLIFSRVSGSAWLREIADLALIAGLMFLPVSFKDPKNKE